MKKDEHLLKKRSQRDYSMSFKMQVIGEVSKRGAYLGSSEQEVWYSGQQYYFAMDQKT